MYFSSVTMRRDGLNVGKVLAVARGDGYAVHRYIWKLFAKMEKQSRDFLYRQEDTGQRMSFYMVSKNPPEDKDGLWNVQVKSYQPKLSAGQRLAFMLRANPVRTKKDKDGKSKRHDVVMDAKSELKEQGVKKEDFPPLPEILQKAGYEWLSARADKYGFSVDARQVRVDGYDKKRLYKKTGKICFSSIDFSGILTVTDPALFLNTLYKGIGPAKSFGCGLLLVRRV